MKSELNDRVPLRQLIVFGAGGLIPIALFNIAGQLIGLIGNISLGLSAFWLGVILIIPRVWDAVSDPIVGHLSDNTRTRWGRRRPYVLVGGISVALSFVMMWWVPKHESVISWFPSEGAFQWFQLSYILVSVLIFFSACTVFEIPHGALGMEITPNSHERTRLFSAKSFFGNLFAMATPWLFALAGMEIFKGPGGSEADGMRYVSILIAIFLIPASIWWFLDLKEPENVEIKTVSNEKRSSFWADMKYIVQNKNFIYLVVTVFTLAMGFNFVSLLNYYISIFYIYGGDKAAAGPLLGINGTIWAITGLLAVFPLNWLSPKMGKRNTLILSIALMVLAQVAKIFCYSKEYPYLMVIPTILLSAGMLFFFTLSTSMLADICDEDDLRSGKRAEGSYYSVYWWFIKMGSAFASLVTGLLIIFTQFDEAQVTRVDDLRGSVNEIRAELGKAEPSKPLQEFLVKAEQKAEALKQHLATEFQGGESSSTHRELLLQNVDNIQNELKNLNAMQRIERIPPSVDVSLAQLTQQTPQSLFMMRLIEISLPIILSLISLLFALKYPLTNQRCEEIQEALKKRNAGLPQPSH
ncbi:hypothetical protein AZI86_05470 [Bdellovibrio bacteriovorus]|uniref:MFS transporter n=1 Tax=Bdellovibrio bacteriovorus TaxID=959 RepID=A0A150WQB1_BDEBC|nr:MFS transporter [Bdellovibrio bacteriovorus]KYG66497.1 hypothetical protein AZI86_05470 [Bdellovibrio bacteriovorus]